MVNTSSWRFTLIALVWLESSTAQPAQHVRKFKNPVVDIHAHVPNKLEFPLKISERMDPNESHDNNAGPSSLESAEKLLALPKLVYYGGPVISNVKIVQVNYGTGNYASYIGTNMSSFYANAFNSTFMDWLSEYNTPTQRIGRGSYIGWYTISPSAVNNGATISDAQIQNELIAQISAGHLPSADSNTLYMINFPSRPDGTIDGGSCTTYCAYHSTAVNVDGSYVYYGVMPDFRGGCASGCGQAPNPYDNYCSVASHEIIEAVTDPAVGQALVYGPPLGWYDSTYGEIGDICNQVQSKVLGADGALYTVQKEWSNKQGACVASGSAFVQPTTQPSTVPSRKPSFRPSLKPSFTPSRKPSNRPSLKPSYFPSQSPTKSLNLTSSGLRYRVASGCTVARNCRSNPYFLDGSNATNIKQGISSQFGGLNNATGNLVSASNFAADWFGYLKVPLNMSGYWTFNFTNIDDQAYLWHGSLALTGYSSTNAPLAINSWGKSANISVSLTGGQSIPIRLFWNDNGGGLRKFQFSVKPPGFNAFISDLRSYFFTA